MEVIDTLWRATTRKHKKRTWIGYHWSVSLRSHFELDLHRNLKTITGPTAEFNCFCPRTGSNQFRGGRPLHPCDHRVIHYRREIIGARIPLFYLQLYVYICHDIYCQLITCFFIPVKSYLTGNEIARKLARQCLSSKLIIYPIQPLPLIKTTIWNNQYILVITFQIKESLSAYQNIWTVDWFIIH